MQPGGSNIAVLLPFAEDFSPNKAGAISLFCHDISLLSRYRKNLVFYGRDGVVPYEKFQYQGLKPRWRFLLGRNKGLAAAFLHFIQKKMPDLIELHNRPQVFFYLKKRLPHVPITFHFHNDPLTMKHTQDAKARVKMLEEATAVYCLSHYIRDRFLEDLEVPESLKEKIHVVYNGIRRVSQSFPEKENIILYVGRMVEEKGTREFVEACLDVLPSRQGWKAIMVGAQRHGQEGTSSGFEEEVYQQFRKLGDQGEFLGHRPYDQVLRLFEKAAIVAVPSKWNEPMGRTAIEALASGSALVSSNYGGLKEINNGCGYVLPEVTRTALTKAFSQLMDSTEKRENIQQKCWLAYDRFEQAAVTEILDGHRDIIFGRRT